MKTTLVPTNTLKAGDTILAHGGLFRVKRAVRWEFSPHDAGRSEVQSNFCDYLGVAPGYDHCYIPESWRADWNEQGNGRARSSLVTVL